MTKAMCLEVMESRLRCLERDTGDQRVARCTLIHSRLSISPVRPELVEGLPRLRQAQPERKNL